MGQGERKVVWILGAGSSVPLGGPLFRDLISPETLRTLKGWDHYTNQSRPLRPDTSSKAVTPAGVLSEIVEAVYRRGLPIKLWGDAEQFLERLEIGAREPLVQLAGEIRNCLHETSGSEGPSYEAKEAMQHLGLDLAVLHAEAIRFVAGACTAFLLRADENPKVVDESEQWDPYRHWYGCLVTGSDSVIDFNYDRVPDILEAHGKRKRPSKDVFISPIGCDPETWQAYTGISVPIYHLHGHVGWKLTADGKDIDLEAGRATLHGAIAYIYPEHSVIGVPGRTKLSLPAGLLKRVWDPAMAAIKTADAIVFVGYRFPETDNMAKRCLIDALKENPDAMTHVVLGNNNKDMPRVRGMLEWTRHTGRVRVHELWAQDFFSVFKREGLFPVY